VCVEYEGIINSFSPKMEQGLFQNDRLINICPVTLEMRSETHAGLHVKCLLLYEFNQNWNVWTNFSKTALYQI
jgi:hypothetical protein